MESYIVGLAFLPVSKALNKKLYIFRLLYIHFVYIYYM